MHNKVFLLPELLTVCLIMENIIQPGWAQSIKRATRYCEYCKVRYANPWNLHKQMFVPRKVSQKLAWHYFLSLSWDMLARFSFLFIFEMFPSWMTLLFAKYHPAEKIKYKMQNLKQQESKVPKYNNQSAIK